MENKPMNFAEIGQAVEVIYRDDAKKLDEALNLAVSEAIKSAISNNKSAKIALSMTFKPGRNREMLIEAEVLCKTPKPVAVITHLFTDGMRGQLFSEDPKQPRFPAGNVIEITAPKGANQ